MVDAALSAFEVFFTQSPSFLEFQRSLEQSKDNHNAQTLFGVHEISPDHHIRTLLDATQPETLKPAYIFLFNALEQAGMVDAHRSVDGTLLLALDGTQHFSSPAIHCERCSTRRHANGQVTYFHSALTPVLVKPGCDKVIALAPEFVTPQDGAAKQDCELTAAKRWQAVHGAAVARLKTTVLGDDLYCLTPFCRLLLDEGLAFILVCKPDSHATTYEWLEHFGRNGAVRTVSRTRWTGQRHETDTCRYAESVPLSDSDGALEVNWCGLVTTDAGGKVLYRNTFATSLTVNAGNVAAVIEARRSSWKIENENENTRLPLRAQFRPPPAAPFVPAGQPHHPGLSDPHRAGVDGRQIPAPAPEAVLSKALVQRHPNLNQLLVL